VQCVSLELTAEGVGKTALVLRYVNDNFSESYPGTIGGSYLAKKMLIVCFHFLLGSAVNDKPCNLQIWDTAGQERFHW
jgi:GTPase SAR1 family protein